VNISKTVADTAKVTCIRKQ